MSDARPLFIAEVKTRSPFGFTSPHPWGQLLHMAIEHGDVVAVHTDERWGGSFAHLAEAARVLGKVGFPDRPHPDRNRPLLLAKGLHPSDDDVRHCLDCGADIVLVVGRPPARELAPVCIWEPTTFDDLRCVRSHAQRVMWNERDLIRGGRKHSGTISDARSVHAGWLGQASFIRSPTDVHAEVDAFIVGEHLPSFVKLTR